MINHVVQELQKSWELQSVVKKKKSTIAQGERVKKFVEDSL